MPIISGGGEGGGGFAPVSCVLQCTALNIHGTGVDIPTKWTGAIDNVWDANPLMALPAGIGVTAAFDGSDATITTTVAGTWGLAFTVAVGSGDDTYVGYFSDSLGVVSALALSGRAAVADTVAAAAVIGLPSGAAFAPLIQSVTSAAGGQTANVQCLLARLA